MIGTQLLDETPVPLAEALRILSERKKEGELGHEQAQDYEYGQKFCKLKPKEANELVEKLKALGLTPYQAVLLVDLMPKKQEEIDIIFAKEKNKPDKALAEKIIKTLEEYRK